MRAARILMLPAVFIYDVPSPFYYFEQFVELLAASNMTLQEKIKMNLHFQIQIIQTQLYLIEILSKILSVFMTSKKILWIRAFKLVSPLIWYVITKP